MTAARVVAVCASPDHTFSKPAQPSIALLAGLGVRGDAHCGDTVKHRSRVAQDPTQPNLRQVHLIHAELFDELGRLGFDIKPGDLGENVTTIGVDLLSLPEDTLLHLGASAVVRLAGLRNPCWQLDNFRSGLTSAVLDRAPDGSLVRKSGVMGVVVTGGEVVAGDPVVVKLPAGPLRPLQRV
jgi:MOSC domain-containing protein YiiM